MFGRRCLAFLWISATHTGPPPLLRDVLGTCPAALDVSSCFFPLVWGANSVVAVRGDLSRCTSRLRPHRQRPRMTLIRQFSIKQVPSFRTSAKYMEETAVVSFRLFSPSWLIVRKWESRQICLTCYTVNNNGLTFSLPQVYTHGSGVALLMQTPSNLLLPLHQSGWRSIRSLTYTHTRTRTNTPWRWNFLQTLASSKTFFAFLLSWHVLLT